MHYLTGLPNFLLYYGSAMGIFMAYLVTYTFITPYDEWSEIKDKRNTSAAIAMSGSIIGFSLPIAGLITHAVNLVDFAVWGGIAIIVQVSTFFLVSLAFKGIQSRIKEMDNSAGFILASISIASGVVNWACMGY